LVRRVPPLNPLHVFFVAAQVGTFTLAAESLGVTPSAVSRQIAVLETYLGARLFHRGLQTNKLTDTGLSFFQEIAPAFEMIESATEMVQGRQDKQPLKLRVLSTFGTRFLIPRLSHFRRLHPSIPVRMDTGFAPVNFAREDVEIAIQLGAGDWPGAESRLLFDSYLQPMCGPALLDRTQPILEIDDLKGYPLLYSKNHAKDWDNWLRARGRPEFPLASLERVEFSNSVLMYQAAADGLGIALGQIPLLSKDLAASVLIPLLGPPIPGGSYYAVWRAGAGPSRKARQFLAWLETELRLSLRPETQLNGL